MAVDLVPARRNGRIGQPKSKNGCLTCKVRRVKCGEEKPNCYRCASTGRRCEYRAVTRYDFRSWSEDTRSESHPLLVLDSRPSGTSECSLELRAFEYFFQRGMPIFPGTRDNRFWKTCILPACQTEPVIWDAVLSLSALFEHPRFSKERIIGVSGANIITPEVPTAVRHPDHQQALSWYNRSLYKLRKSLEQGTANDGVALISCIIYMCIEMLQDNGTEVVQLYHHGASIISSCHSSMVADCAAPLLYDFSAHATVMAYITPDQALRPISDVPEWFLTLEDAEVALYRLVPGLTTHHRSSSMALLAGRVEGSRFGAMEAAKAMLGGSLGRWLQNFKALGITLEGNSSEPEKFAVAKLLQVHATLHIMVETSTSLFEMEYDSMMSDFEDIVYYGRWLIAAMRYADGSHPPFSLETSVALPLFICALKCRDYRLRYEALDLLRKAPRVQGLCKATSHALLASKVIKIEEAGLECTEMRDGKGPTMFIPESQRIHNLAVSQKAAEEDGGKVWVLTYHRNVPDEAGRYRVVEEMSSFEASDYPPA